MSKTDNLENQNREDSLIKLLDSQVVKINKFFSGSRFQTSAEFRKLLIGVVLAFGVLIFFLNTVDLNKVRIQSSVNNNLPPPPPPEVMVPPEPPAEILSESSVQGLQTAQIQACYDFDGDGKVNQADVDLMIPHGNSQVGEPNYDPKFDLNNDGVISGFDLAMVLSQVGRVCANPSPTPTPSPYPPGVLYPYDLKVSLDMGCAGPPSAQMVLFSWKPARSNINWRVDVSDNNWQTRHSIYRFQISGDRIVVGWSTSNPMNDGLAPAFDTSYKWRVSNGLNEVSGLDFRTLRCATPSPTLSPRPSTPTPTPLPPTASCAPLRIVSVNSPVQLGQEVTVGIKVNGYSCQGMPAWSFLYNTRTRALDRQMCLISGDGCTIRHQTRSLSSGNYSVIIVADLDRDGKWYEPGEYSVRTISVIGPSPSPWIWPWPVSP